jgi:hypothetical protein
MEPGLRSPRFWRRLSLTAMISPAFLAFDLVTQLFSPYEFNPLNLKHRQRVGVVRSQLRPHRRYGSQPPRSAPRDESKTHPVPPPE